MPAAIPAVIATAAASAATWAAGTAITFAFVAKTFAINLALGLVSRALTPKPSSISAAQAARDNLQTVREPVSTRKIIYGTTRIGGSIVYLESTGTDNKYMHLVIAFAGHECEKLETIYFNDEAAYSTDSGYLNDYGSVTEVNWHDGSQTTADANLVSRSSNWTSDHVLNGIAYAYIRLKFNRDKFPQGIPNITATIRGKKVYDPRTGLTAFSNNPALCIRDYLTNTQYGMSAATTEINENSFISAANLCEESVELAAGGTQQRFTIDGIVDTAENRAGILESMLSAMAGSLVYSGGEFFVYGSAYRIPTVTLDESVVIAPIQIQTKRSRRELFNGVKGVFNSQADNYVLADYPAVSSATYAAEDGEAVYLDVDLPYTVDSARAQRIAKLSLLRSRQQITAKIVCNLSALQLKAGDTVMINNTRMGWSSKVFEITNLTMAASAQGQLSVELEVIETDAAVYDWTTDDELDFTAGLATTLPAPNTVNAPSGLSVSATAAIQDDGTARPAIIASWTNNDAFATHFEFQYSKDGGVSYASVVTQEPRYRLEDVEVGTSYSLRVRAVNRLGARSDFASTSETGVGDSTAPAVPTSLTATGQTDGIYLKWTNPSDADFDVVEIWESTDSVQGNATLIATTRGTAYTRGGLTAGVTRYYWLKAKDFSGNTSGFNSPTGVSATTSIPFDDTRYVGRIEVVNSLTAGLTNVDAGKVEYLTTDETLYKWDGSAWQTGVVIDDDVGEILAQHINVANLSAINADVGTITAGTLSDSTGDKVKLDLDNQVFTMSDGTNELVRIGNDGSNNYIVRVSDGTNSTTLTPKLGSLIASGTTTISTTGGLNGNGTIGNAISLGATYDFDDLDVLVTIKGYRPMQLNYWAYYGTNFPNAPGIWSKYDLPLGPSGTYKYYTQSGTDATTGRPTYTQNTSIGQYTGGSVQALYYDSLMYHSAYAFWEKGSQTSASEVFITAYVRHRHYENDTASARWLYETQNSIEVEYAIIAKNYTG